MPTILFAACMDGGILISDALYGYISGRSRSLKTVDIEPEPSLLGVDPLGMPYITPEIKPVAKDVAEDVAENVVFEEMEEEKTRTVASKRKVEDSDHGSYTVKQPRLEILEQDIAPDIQPDNEKTNSTDELQKHSPSVPEVDNNDMSTDDKSILAAQQAIADTALRDHNYAEPPEAQDPDYIKIPDESGQSATHSPSDL